MKHLMILAAFALLGTAATAQTTTTTATADAREHVCTAACTPEAHAYAHGEKGHACTAACASTAGAAPHACCAGKKEGEACTKGTAEADAQGRHAGKKGRTHVCTEACKGDVHAYACGEKGHTCNATCTH